MPTLEQFSRERFFRALDGYRVALRSRDPAAIVATSIEIHAAKSGVPKRLHPLVGRAFRANGAV